MINLSFDFDGGDFYLADFLGGCLQEVNTLPVNLSALWGELRFVGKFEICATTFDKMGERD